MLGLCRGRGTDLSTENSDVSSECDIWKLYFECVCMRIGRRIGVVFQKKEGGRCCQIIVFEPPWVQARDATINLTRG